MDVVHQAGLPRPVQPGDALEVVAQAEAHAVVDAVAGRRQVQSQPSGLDLHRQYPAPGVPFIQGFDPPRYFVVGTLHLFGGPGDDVQVVLEPGEDHHRLCPGQVLQDVAQCLCLGVVHLDGLAFGGHGEPRGQLLEAHQPGQRVGGGDDLAVVQLCSELEGHLVVQLPGPGPQVDVGVGLDGSGQVEGLRRGDPEGQPVELLVQLVQVLVA